MVESTAVVSLSRRELDLFISRLITKGLIILGVIAIISVVQMVRLGASERHVMLLASSVLSMLILFAYPIRIVRDRGEPRRSLMGFVTAFGGFIPYLFGCYLVFYEGFWSLRRLLDGFSVAVLLIALLYIVGGYLIVSAIYKVSEFGRAVDAGRLKID